MYTVQWLCSCMHSMTFIFTPIDSYLQNVHTDVVPSQCICKFKNLCIDSYCQSIHCTLTNFVCLLSVPEIGFIGSSGRVWESAANYTITVQSSVAGGLGSLSGLVEIYILQENSGEPGYATGGYSYKLLYIKLYCTYILAVA